MTVKEFERIVLRIVNQSFARFWYHYNWPVEEPWLMAIMLMKEPVLGDELLKAGFREGDSPGLYVIERDINNDGGCFD